jgi:hypothetical protein
VFQPGLVVNRQTEASALVALGALATTLSWFNAHVQGSLCVAIAQSGGSLDGIEQDQVGSVGCSWVIDQESCDVAMVDG